MSAQKDDEDDFEPENNDTGDDVSEIEIARQVSVGGGSSKYGTMVILGLCLFGILYGLVSFLTAHSD